MAGASYPEAFVGLLLVFFLPGYTIVKATFPEWRIRGRAAYLRFLEIVTLALVLSVVLTVLVGSLLLLTPAGFQAYWTDPVLEVVLAAVAFLALLVGWLRGAYRREPPPAPEPSADDSEEGAWELSRELEAIGREERRLRHVLRVGSHDDNETARLNAELARLESRRDELRREREAEYAS
ncbi:MAG TPA: DUF1616 domain-containing protein [Thermoplasmata archaeon]|nr:DUF1616 domain-containing protein [Thermoplasmata archaeon]